jgi:hypothetical protein
MAHQVIPEEYLGDFPQETAKKEVKDSVVVAASKVSSGVAGILDFLIVLTAAFWYYFFTGLAILCKRDIPKQWLALGTHMGMRKVTAHINKVNPRASSEVLASENTPKRSFKVVDVDTKRPLKVMKVSK